MQMASVGGNKKKNDRVGGEQQQDLDNSPRKNALVL